MHSAEKTTPKKAQSQSNFLTESVEEIKKVTWPTRNKAVRLTLLVLGFCFASAIIIGFVDFVLSTGNQALIDLAPQRTLPTITDVPNDVQLGEITAVTQEQTQQTQTQQSGSEQSASQTQQAAPTSAIPATQQVTPTPAQ